MPWTTSSSPSRSQNTESVMMGRDLQAQRIWITGARGFLGSYVVDHFQKAGSPWQVMSLDRCSLDLTDAASVERMFHQSPPSVIVHCAAWADAARCEENEAVSRAINVDATVRLATLARDRRFVYLSTDLVFDGQQGGYREADRPNPLHVYGSHKFEAEQQVLQNPMHTVLRTSLVAGQSRSGNRSFNERMLGAWREGKTLSLFHDEYRNPIAASLLAQVIHHAVEARLQGLFHVAGRERFSRVEMGQLCRTRHPDIVSPMIACSLKDYQGPRRAPDTTLDCSKLQRVLPFPLLGLREWLDKHPEFPF